MPATARPGKFHYDVEEIVGEIRLDPGMGDFVD